MKAYLSYQFKDDVSGIIKLLEAHNVEILDAKTDLESGKSLPKVMKDSIRSCDLMVLIFSSVNDNIPFEAGLGFGLNKPIFSVVGDVDDASRILANTTYVHAMPSEIDKIEFNLKIFLDKIRPKVSTSKNRPKKIKYWGGGYPNYYNQISTWFRAIEDVSEESYEQFLGRIFNLYRMSVIKNREDSNVQFATDFCIWSDDLGTLIGNPILIEVKHTIGRDNIDELKRSVLSLVENNSAESCLVFYGNLRDIEKAELPNTPRCLFIEISDFVERFKTLDFNGSIRQIRNEIVHNQF